MDYNDYRFKKSDINTLEEARITNFYLGFPKDVQPNFKDYHAPMKPFNSNWGRGVVGKIDGKMVAIVSNYSYSHAQIKKHFDEVLKTIYWGYDTQLQTLYVTDASLPGIDYNAHIKTLIVSALLDQKTGPLKRVQWAMR